MLTAIPPRTDSSSGIANLAAIEGARDSLDPVSTEPDAPTQQALEHWQAEAARANAQGALQDVNERRTFARYMFRLLCCWIVFDGVILVWTGMGRFGPYPFFLSNSVLIALLTTSTASIVGLFLVVAKHLFPGK